MARSNLVVTVQRRLVVTFARHIIWKREREKKTKAIACGERQLASSARSTSLAVQTIVKRRASCTTRCYCRPIASQCHRMYIWCSVTRSRRGRGPARRERKNTNRDCDLCQMVPTCLLAGEIDISTRRKAAGRCAAKSPFNERDKASTATTRRCEALLCVRVFLHISSISQGEVISGSDVNKREKKRKERMCKYALAYTINGT